MLPLSPSIFAAAVGSILPAIVVVVGIDSIPSFPTAVPTASVFPAARSTETVRGLPIIATSVIGSALPPLAIVQPLR